MTTSRLLRNIIHILNNILWAKFKDLLFNFHAWQRGFTDAKGFHVSRYLHREGMEFWYLHEYLAEWWSTYYAFHAFKHDEAENPPLSNVIGRDRETPAIQSVCGWAVFYLPNNFLESCYLTLSCIQFFTPAMSTLKFASVSIYKETCRSPFLILVRYSILMMWTQFCLLKWKTGLQHWQT